MKSLKTIFARAALPAMLAMVPALASAQSSPIPINACGVISPDPGGNKNYVLTQDLNAPAGLCLTFQGVANATLDGQGHAIVAAAALTLQNSPSVTVRNVTFGNNTSGNNTLPTQVQVQNSTYANIVSNVFNHGLLIIDTPSTAPFIGGNTFNNATGYSSADYTAFMGNTFALTDGRPYPAAIQISRGTGHHISSNTIDGGWDGHGFDRNSNGLVGADDGILLGSTSAPADFSTSYAYVAGNNIKNVGDAGIETVGRVTGTTIGWNNIDTAGIAGIGAYYGTSWSGNTVFGNNVSRAPALFLFSRLDPLYSGEQYVLFSNNYFTANTISSPTPVGFNGAPSGFYFSSTAAVPVPVPASSIVVGGNSFNSNTFNGLPGPYIYPHPLGVDGDGHNKCLGPPPNDPDPASYPLHCTPP